MLHWWREFADSRTPTTAATLKPVRRRHGGIIDDVACELIGTTSRDWTDIGAMRALLARPAGRTGRPLSTDSPVVPSEVVCSNDLLIKIVHNITIYRG